MGQAASASASASAPILDCIQKEINWMTYKCGNE